MRVNVHWKDNAKKLFRKSVPCTGCSKYSSGERTIVRLPGATNKAAGIQCEDAFVLVAPCANCGTVRLIDAVHAGLIDKVEDRPKDG